MGAIAILFLSLIVLAIITIIGFYYYSLSPKSPRRKRLAREHDSVSHPQEQAQEISPLKTDIQTTIEEMQSQLRDFTSNINEFGRLIHEHSEKLWQHENRVGDNHQATIQNRTTLKMLDERVSSIETKILGLNIDEHSGKLMIQTPDIMELLRKPKTIAELNTLLKSLEEKFPSEKEQEKQSQEGK